METELKPVNPADLKDLQDRMELISKADPSQYHNDYSLKRYLRAFKSTNDAFKAILKTNKWRVKYGISELNLEHPAVQSNMLANKARVLKHRDMRGRPIIYIPAKNHSATARDVDMLTQFIVYCLEEACKKCFEEVVDNLCIIFDLQDFSIGCMDYQIIKNLIWLLSKHYPERLGVCLVINSPGFFCGCWAVIKGWLDENTTSKVIFVNSEKELCSYLIPDVLPTNI